MDQEHDIGFKRLDQQVMLVAAKWRKEVTKVDEANCYVEKKEEGWLCTIGFPLYGELAGNILVLDFPVRLGEMDLEQKGHKYKIKAYGLIKLGPGTWQVEPRIEQNPIHAHVVLCNCPEPAPWEEVCQKDYSTGNSNLLRIEESDTSSRVV